MNKMRHILRSLILPILILISSKTIAQEVQTDSLRHAYLGIAGNGSGMGMFGHAFLLFSSSRGDFFSSRIYQYNIQVPEDFKLTFGSAFDVQTFPFRVFAEKGIPFIQRYVAENRAVYLYELDLSDSAVKQLLRNVEADKTFRDKKALPDYNLATNNCVTKTYEQINAVTTHGPRFTASPYVPNLSSFYRISRESISLAVPLASPLVMKNHPLIKSVHYFKPKRVLEYERLLEQKRALQILTKSCGTSQGVANALDFLTSNIRTASSAAYISTIREQFSACALKDQTARTEQIRIFDISRYFATDERVRESIDRALAEIL
ncbi:MAG: DUF4105 domain-containing protein [Bdellovibrionaceae bacterium]|nr:DUF4105 domain-containing protein [Pseudobdellovibrionaceae bacterium]